MKKNPALAAALAEFERHGIAVSVKQGRRHLILRWSIGGRPYSLGISTTPSDWRAPVEARCQVRRMFRQAGAEAAE
jgi:hypothetical protein